MVPNNTQRLAYFVLPQQCMCISWRKFFSHNFFFYWVSREVEHYYTFFPGFRLFFSPPIDRITKIIFLPTTVPIWGIYAFVQQRMKSAECWCYDDVMKIFLDTYDNIIEQYPNKREIQHIDKDNYLKVPFHSFDNNKMSQGEWTDINNPSMLTFSVPISIIGDFICSCSEVPMVCCQN